MEGEVTSGYGGGNGEASSYAIVIFIQSIFIQGFCVKSKVAWVCLGAKVAEEPRPYATTPVTQESQYSICINIDIFRFERSLAHRFPIAFSFPRVRRTALSTMRKIKTNKYKRERPKTQAKEKQRREVTSCRPEDTYSAVLPVSRYSSSH